MPTHSDDMNTINLVGELVNGPFTSDGESERGPWSKTFFVLHIVRNKSHAYVPVTIWNPKKDQSAALVKGSWISVTGYVTTRPIDIDGKKKSNVEVIAESVSKYEGAEGQDAKTSITADDLMKGL